jgi:hypothetical protein
VPLLPLFVCIFLSPPLLPTPSSLGTCGRVWAPEWPWRSFACASVYSFDVRCALPMCAMKKSCSWERMEDMCAGFGETAQRTAEDAHGDRKARSQSCLELTACVSGIFVGVCRICNRCTSIGFHHLLLLVFVALSSVVT